LAFDLKETRVSAGDGAAYVSDEDPAAYARALVDLLDDEVSRALMGAAGRHRIQSELGWPHQRQAYLRVYDALVWRPPTTHDVVIDLREEPDVTLTAQEQPGHAAGPPAGRL
jgi:hypothetical protein